MTTPSQIRVLEDRHQELLADGARARLIRTATQPATTATPRPVTRRRTGLRQAIASLVAFVAIG